MKDMKVLEQRIKDYLDYFQNQLQKIRNLECKKPTDLFRKILYSSLLDALSKTTAHPKKGNRERIVDFIHRFCNWSTCEKVSLPHLLRLLEMVPDPAFSDLRQHVFSILDKWEEPKLIYINSDLDYKDVMKYWPNDIPKPLENIRIEFLQHVNLFYRYRNSLIHESRKPGDGIEFPNMSEPYYHSMNDNKAKQETWELVYPLKFFDSLCDAAIKNLKEYYLKDRIDPYSCYKFGTYWIEELNK